MQNEMFKVKPNFKESEIFKLFYNVGCLMDIPTGKYVLGKYGESILLGGIAPLTAIAGRGNTFKSTIAHYLILSAADKVAASGNMTYINTYDTEVNISSDRLSYFSKKFDRFKDIDLIESGLWNITDKTQYQGNAWFEILKEFLKTEKVKNKSKYIVKTPFLNNKGEPVSSIFPTFGEIDSISEFETADIQDIQDKNELGESGGNMIHMRLGLAKTRLLMELPTLCNSSAHYMVMTAHVGTDTPVQQGPYAIPVKKLQHMKMGDKIKGVTDKFFFLPNLFWQTIGSSLLINQSTKGAEYPKHREDNEEHGQDLNIVTLKQLRNKNGPSGVSVEIIISQAEGVLPSLTEFHFIKENGRYGLEGNNVNYSLSLLPDVKITRPTIRNLIDTNPNLRRAIKITSDLLQMKNVWRHLELNIPDPKDIYEKLNKTYDWNILLDTRDWWTFDNESKNLKPFLSTMDIINMYYDKYRPYWYPK